MTEKAPERVRDAERTREAILAAAEELFARLGFDAASLHQIALAAGVARATPAYFFRSKEALYDAVLARVVTRAQEAMTRAYTESDQAASPEDAVESYVGAWLEFLSSDLNFLRLMQREALGDGSRITEFSAALSPRVWPPSGRPRRRPASRQSVSSSTSPRSAGIRSRTSTRSCPCSG